ARASPQQSAQLGAIAATQRRQEHADRSDMDAELRKERPIALGERFDLAGHSAPWNAAEGGGERIGKAAGGTAQGCLAQSEQRRQAPLQMTVEPALHAAAHRVAVLRLEQ